MCAAATAAATSYNDDKLAFVRLSSSRRGRAARLILSETWRCSSGCCIAALFFSSEKREAQREILRRHFIAKSESGEG